MLKKFLVYVFLILFAFGVEAKFDKIEIIDSSLQKAVLKESKIDKKDLKVYGDIFTAIRENRIEDADNLVSKLKSDALMGHVLAQKYLSAKYISNYKELKLWLKKYPNLPQYGTIDRLAKTKAPGYKAPPKKVVKKTLYAPYAWFKESYSQLKPNDRKFVRGQLVEFLKAIRKTDNKKAESIMKNERFRMTIPDRFYDGMTGTLVNSYFYDADYESALKWSEKAIRRSRDPIATWFAGMAAWKMNDYKKSAELFEKLYSFNNEDQWFMASAAFWAYRANEKLGKSKNADKYLRLAAQKRGTFYGIFLLIPVC